MKPQQSDRNITLVIDATSVTNRVTGIERYTREVTKEIVRQGQTKKYRITVLLARHAAWLTSNGSAVKIHRSPFTSRIMTEQIWIPWIVTTLKPTH